MGTKKLLLVFLFFAALVTASYRLVGRDRIPVPLVELIDKFSDGYSRLETSIVNWFHEAGDDVVKSLVPEKKETNLPEEK